MGGVRAGTEPYGVPTEPAGYGPDVRPCPDCVDGIIKSECLQCNGSGSVSCKICSGRGEVTAKDFDFDYEDIDLDYQK
jgi:hypothetical protein